MSPNTKPTVGYTSTNWSMVGWLISMPTPSWLPIACARIHPPVLTCHRESRRHTATLRGEVSCICTRAYRLSCRWQPLTRPMPPDAGPMVGHESCFITLSGVVISQMVLAPDVSLAVVMRPRWRLTSKPCYVGRPVALAINLDWIPIAAIPPAYGRTRRRNPNASEPRFRDCLLATLCPP